MKFVRILHVCFLLVIQHATIYSVLFLNDNIDTPACLAGSANGASTLLNGEQNDC
jgi:hypothetical protein